MNKLPARTKTLYLSFLGVSLLLALPTALWPQIDLAVAAYFLQTNPAPSQWFWVDPVNEYTPDTFRTLAFACLGAWIVATLVPRWRRAGLALAFVGMSLTLGPGLATWTVKEIHLRARPFDVVQFGGTREFTPALVQANQCTDNCAFVSGHVACGFFFASLILIDPRRRFWWLGMGLVGGLGIGLARMSVGAHWLSDVLWACPITLLTSWLVWHVLALFYHPKHPAPQKN